MLRESVASRLNRLTLQNDVPLSAQLELTYRCPLSCRHCYLPATRGRGLAAGRKELSTGEWKKALGELKELGCFFLVFTGGEPLLRPDLPELCRHATKLGFDIRVFTSGVGLTPGLLAELKNLNISRFETSCYGRACIHDAVTGQPGSAASTLAAARLIKLSGFRVKLKTPLMKATAGELIYIRKLAKREGFSFAFDPVLTLAADGEKSSLALRVSAAQLKKLLSDPKLNPLLENLQGISDPESPVCGGGRNTISVNPYGEVFPCLQFGVKLGDLRKKPLKAIWKNSAWLKKWRKTSVSGLEDCRACPDLDYCSRCPGVSLLETGNIDKPYKTACLMAKQAAKSLKKRS